MSSKGTNGHPKTSLSGVGAIYNAARGRYTTETSCLHRLWRQRFPGARMETEAMLGTKMVGRNPAHWTRGCGARHVDLMSPVWSANPPYRIVEAKRFVTPGNLDAAVGSLVLERALLEAESNVAPHEIHPVAAFDGAAFDPYGDIPETMRVMVQCIDELGITLELATGNGFVSLNEVVVR
ncbi:hypothetical protein [Natronosalvus rutilus]|uniref:Uncharacterized protein n=1 Tax=Natronosalvus rutilus TaxID=2953753 RepID=A0A9E7SUE3_9EURY|nr:hypothetical protein [Natronosalvus rutilus]UTF52767.1 hypothetical protein NGM29_13370 [Natronosalvus rutilus]